MSRFIEEDYTVIGTARVRGISNRRRSKVVSRAQQPAYSAIVQTGGRNYDETVPQPSTIKIYHYSEHASYIEVSVAPEK
jgi:hypothetical protein